MAEPVTSTLDGFPLRFFFPEQIDQLLRHGARNGRAGSHAAIERILKHEPALKRPTLWLRNRQLKDPPSHDPYQHSVWSPEDDQTLRQGYEAGCQGKRDAVRELLTRHPTWRRNVIWRRAAKLRLTTGKGRKGGKRSCRPWSEKDDRILLRLAGYKFANAIGRRLHRTERAVIWRLAMLGKSSGVHLEGFARRPLAEELHLGTRTLQRWIAEGLLEVRDPRVTKRSLRDLRKTLQNSGALPARLDYREEPAPHPLSSASDTPGVETTVSGNKAPVGAGSRSSRAKQFWEDAARTLGVNVETVEVYIARGTLKLQDPRIAEESLKRFCRSYGSLINYTFLNQETRTWLRKSMDLIPSGGEPLAQQMACRRRHAQIVRRCDACGGTIRGNAYFRHIKRCIARRSVGANPWR